MYCLSSETGRRAPVAPVSEPGNPWQYPDAAAAQHEPHRMQMSDRPEVGSGDADFGHARGGNGIFGEPIVSFDVICSRFFTCIYLPTLLFMLSYALNTFK